jgi:hypothetical protein
MKKQLIFTIIGFGMLLASLLKIPMRIQTQTKDKYRYHYEQIIK